jgi:hypothetical protein
MRIAYYEIPQYVGIFLQGKVICRIVHNEYTIRIICRIFNNNMQDVKINKRN